MYTLLSLTGTGSAAIDTHCSFFYPFGRWQYRQPKGFSLKRSLDWRFVAPMPDTLTVWRLRAHAIDGDHPFRQIR